MGRVLVVQRHGLRSAEPSARIGLRTGRWRSLHHPADLSDVSTLAEVFASGGTDIIIRTLELTCDAWPEPVLICNGFRDQVLTTEDGRILTFVAANIDIALPKKNNKGNQSLAFSVDNTTGEVQRKADAALEAHQRVTAIYRTYLNSNKSAPRRSPTG